MVKGSFVVRMDKYGKIFLPKQIRTKFETDRFEVIIEEDELHLKPIKKAKELFGILPGITQDHIDEVHNENHELPD